MMHWFKKFAAVSAVALVAACGGSDDPAPPGTLAQEATARGFSALVAAADKAGLVPALSSGTSSLIRTGFCFINSATGALAGRYSPMEVMRRVTAPAKGA